MSSFIPALTRYCPQCSSPIIRRAKDGARRYEERKFCSRACTYAGQIRNGGKPRYQQRDPKRRWQSAKLTEQQVFDMRSRRAHAGATYESLAREHGVSYSAVWHAVNHATWSHLRGSLVGLAPRIAA